MATVHLVPSFHYDLEYLLSEGPYLEISFRNLLEAHRLLTKHADYTFRAEQVYLLERFFGEYPSLTEDFRRFSQEQRFEVAAGMYTMADFNMAGGESLIRQMVTGKRWCQEVLGTLPRVLDVGDCTGQTAQMPQIARICGYDYITFERAVDDVGRKCEIRWKGIDESEIPTYWLAVGGYAGWGYLKDEDHAVRLLPDLIKQLQQHCLSPHRVLAQGGDFNYPFERGIRCVQRWNQEHQTQIVYSTYTRGLDAVDFAAAPLHDGEWNPDRQGCYSSRIRVKQANRQCEALLAAAEAVSALARQFHGIPVDHEGLCRAWKLTFVNQFHDILWGTVLDEAYSHALERLGRVRMICKQILDHRLRLLGARSNNEQRRVIVFNPLPWPRKAWVQVPLGGLTDKVELLADDGGEAGAQRRGQTLSFPAELPACGLRAFTIRQVDVDRCEAAVGPSLKANTPFAADFVKTESGQALEVATPLYDVRFLPGGVIGSLRDKRSEVEYVDGSRPAFNAICYQTDHGDLWQYYDGPLLDGGPYGPAADLIEDPYPIERHAAVTRNGRRLYLDVLDNREGEQADFSIIRKEPDRLIVGLEGVISRKFPVFDEFEQEGIRIEWQQQVTFYRDDPLIEFQLLTRHIKGKWYRLRAAFFTDIKSGTICHEIPFGRFNRPQGEFAAQNYIAYYDRNKGLALLNRGLPGNNVTDGVMMLSLMRSVSIQTRVESEKAFELGQSHCFNYGIIPFAGEPELKRLQLARRGLEFVHTPYVYDSAAPSQENTFQLQTEAAANPLIAPSLLALEPSSVACTAVCPENEQLLIRLYESEGQPTEATLKFNFSIKGAVQTDALLNVETPLSIKGQNVLTVPLTAFQIKTILIEPVEPGSG